MTQIQQSSTSCGWVFNSHKWSENQFNCIPHAIPSQNFSVYWKQHNFSSPVRKRPRPVVGAFQWVPASACLPQLRHSGQCIGHPDSTMAFLQWICSNQQPDHWAQQVWSLTLCLYVAFFHNWPCPWIKWSDPYSQVHWGGSSFSLKRHSLDKKENQELLEGSDLSVVFPKMGSLMF